MSNQGNIINMNNTQVFSSMQDSRLFNNQSHIDNNIIYTTYQNVSSQSSVEAPQGPQVNSIPSAEMTSYQQFSQTPYVNSTSFPSPMSVNINNDKFNVSNQNQNILYSPVSTASSASPSASNAFNSTDPISYNQINNSTNNLSSSVLNNNYNGQENNSIVNSSEVNVNVNEENINTNMINNKSKSQTFDNNNNNNYNNNNNNNNNNNSSATLYTSYSNINSNSCPSVNPGSSNPSSTINQQQNLSPSMNNNTYPIQNQTQTIYSSNQYISPSTNPYLGLNDSQYQNQAANQAQTTPLPTPQQNVHIIGNTAVIPQHSSNPQAPPTTSGSYALEQNIPQQNNQNLMVFNNTQGNVQGQPMSVYQNATNLNQVYYNNGQGTGQVQNSMPSQPIIFNNVNKNIIYEQQKMISMELAIKRKKNTEAARRSRMRKMLRMENLEKYVKQLESENNSLTMKIAVLEGSKPEWNEKESKLRDKIRKLERALAEYKLKENNEDKEEKQDKKIKQENSKEFIKKEE
ncbi:hypothetical protein H8356DRAFT_1058890 [Neocallimastix lanati (nom. inval.)]|nr:hypothetical protein H8356DRAFT_1058890 [Neocallimastix sp. JGI-2020a]